MNADLSRMLEAGLDRVHDADLLSRHLGRRADSDAQLRILGFEILLKCAIKLCGGKPKQYHYYYKLWGALPGYAQAEILATAKDRMPGNTDFSNLQNLLEAYQHVFEKARYPYELYEGWSAEEVRKFGEYWVSIGAPIEEADIKYYPNELTCLIEGLEVFIRKGLSNNSLQGRRP